MSGRRGRNKYHTHVEPKLLLVEAWARDGFTEEQTAAKLGVAYSTFRTYKDKYPALLAALKRGQEVADVEVENALFKRAVGYRYDEVTREADKVLDQDTGQLVTVMVETKRVTKEVQPETAAAIFWLKNRRPGKWRDKQEIGHSGSVDVNNPLQGLTTAELRKLIRDG
ncbi:transposase [Paenibacillus motobuensis]|uniref:transposase n=1 Tax=Paenibacillus TaxID=44249 RepID=UPI0020410BCC|nr:MULTISPECIES: transposase [Paenibacillus]MCM3041702.1 transposase [Paenibacillus lutimineralis]MCM3648806.1 transposase [Paenibacillus motobuensis]